MTPEERWAEAKAVQTMTPKDVVQTDSTDIIRELRDEQAAKPAMTAVEFAEEARKIRAMTPRGVAQTDSTEIIRELRDGGYAGR